jgi:arsenical pump membrane protein
MNNLPSGLLAGGALQTFAAPSPSRCGAHRRGSRAESFGHRLATLPWLIALRKEGEQVLGWRFLKVGFLMMPPALLLATALLSR